MRTIYKHRGETLTLAATGSIDAPQIRVIPSWANLLTVHAPSATLENILLAFAPKIKKVYHFDASALGMLKWIDLTEPLLDRNTSRLATLTSLATADFVYVGFLRKTRGLFVDLTTVNAEVATIAAANSIGNDAWATLTVTDGTITGGNTSLGEDGLITWTVPPSWKPMQLKLEDGTLTENLFWVRFSWNVALTATVTMDQAGGLANLNLNGALEIVEGQDRILIRSNNDTLPPFEFPLDDWAGAIELTSTGITSTALLNWYQVKEK